jgi:hypothetical protein
MDSGKNEPNNESVKSLITKIEVKLLVTKDIPP